MQPSAAEILKLLTSGGDVTFRINVLEVLVQPFRLVTVIVPV